MRARERGLSILFVAVVLLVVAAGTLAFLALTRTAGGVDRSTETTTNLAKVAAALEQFASATERLPCPANPALDTGDAEPNTGTANCTYPTGTVPWRTLALRREDSLDAWGSKLSYRVYQGATGLTQVGGASMVPCDTVEPAPAGTTGAGLCRASHDTTEAQFLSGKGLALSDFGTAVTDAAYVIVSHGPSGLGAYTAAGIQKTPGPASADEIANLAAAGPFVAKAAVSAVAPESATHFDDLLAYRRLADFVKRANLSARDWPEPAPGVIADLTFNSATVASATGSTPSAGSLGQSTVNFPNATVTGLDSGGTQALAFDTSAGTEGIGGAAGGNLLSSAGGEGVRVDLSQKARRVAVTFAHFGRITAAGSPREQATFVFYDAGVQVLSLTKQGCRPDGDLATFSIDAGVDFNRVEIRAVVASDGASPTDFLLGQFLACDAATVCATSLSVPGNTCL